MRVTLLIVAAVTSLAGRPGAARADAWPGTAEGAVHAAVVAAGRAPTRAEADLKATVALQLDLGPRDRALAQLAQGLARYRQGRYRPAAEALLAAESGPLAVRDFALFMAAEATFHAGDYAGARMLLQRLLKAHPRSDWRHRARFRLGDCERGLDRLTPARVAWEKWMEVYPEYPSGVAVRFALAEVDRLLGRLRPAAGLLREVIARWPNDPLSAAARRSLGGLSSQDVEPPAVAPEVLYQTGYDLRKRKYFGAALQMLQGLLTHPRAQEALRKRARLQIGRTLLQMEHLDEALATFERLAEESAGSLKKQARYWQSQVLDRMGRTQDAAAALIASTGRPADKLDVETRQKLAWLFFHGGQYAEAIRRFDELGGAGAGPWMRAWLAFRDGRFAEARDGFLRLGRGRRWQSERYQYWAARAQVRLGALPEAEALYRQVVDRAPGSFYAWQARLRLEELGRPLPPPVGQACEGQACDPGDGPQDPTVPLGELATRWGGALPGLEAAYELAVVGDDRMAAWRLRAVRDEVIAHSLAGRPGRWRYLYRPYVDNRDEEERAEWGRLLDEKPVVSDPKRTKFLRAPRPALFNDLLQEGFRTLGDHYYVRRMAWNDPRPQEPPEAPANNAAWRLRYPRAYRSLMEQHAAARGLDPHLLWAFMTVESSFNPWALSRVGARGLMQVMPHTGSLIGDRMAIRGFGTALLFEPEVVIEMAAWYVDQLLTKFDGQLPLAIAAYNAGPHRVAAWLDAKGHLPMDEFIEEMPYDEAREYTKKVLRHLALYHRIYEGRVVWPVGQVVDPHYRDNINF
ncbi:MAG: transglycosylase SLT domain-containing protein [bacterium]